MKKITIILIFIINALANTYSIQLYSAKNIKYAKLFLKKAPQGSFLYHKNSNYWTVRYKLFNSEKQAFLFATKNHLHNVFIVPTDTKKLSKIKIPNHKIKKTFNAKKWLTPCNKCITNKCVKSTKKQKWELNQTKISQNIHIKIHKIALIEQPKKIEQNKTKQICYNKLLRFYTKADIMSIQGQTPLNSQQLEGTYENLKIGLQYGCYFDNFKFYTDDMATLYAKQKNNNNQAGVSLTIKELYLQSYNILQNRFDFIIGRKKIKDYRSWIYDNSLDIIKVFNMHDLWKYEIIAGTKFNNDTVTTNKSLSTNNLKDTKFFILKGDYQYYINRHLSGFFVFENTSNYLDRNINWLILRNHAYLENFQYWVDFSKSNGTDYMQNLDGYAYEMGIEYLPQTSKYLIGIGYANSQKSYTQPIMADNKSNFLNKNIKLRYYGLFLDPELNNLNILSLYWFYNYSPKKTFTVMFHQYQQHQLSNTLNCTSYVVNTNNKNKNIGSEIDFIYKFILPYQYNYKFSFAYFMGGSAFDNTATKKDGIYAKFNFIYYW